ncbi:MMPL family transporter [Spirillospora sp. NPDC048911]|uniref:MMPL family transporter n=1 Tax=Spirillospora sp. NPDC048911 TaxID=3364527 RepID=UPI003716F21E
MIHRRRLLAVAFVLMAVLGMISLGLDRRLSNGGFIADGTESTRADAVLARRFQAGPSDLVLRVTADDRVDSPEAARAGVRLSRWIAAQESVELVQSYWLSPDPALRSADQRSALLRVAFRGDGADATRAAEELVPRMTEQARPLRVATTGLAWAEVQALRMARQDLHRAELLTAPLLAIILLLAFRSAYAALLPLLIASLTIVATLAVLRLSTHVMQVTVYAPNVAMGLGFGLAIDYSLFITTRFRDELSRGAGVEEALQRTMMTAGRTVLFSGLTVATATACLFVIPLDIVRSLAWTTIVVVAMGAASTMLVQPAMLAAVGAGIDRGDPVGWLRRRSAHRPSPAAPGTDPRMRLPWARRRRTGGRETAKGAWHRIAAMATRWPVWVGGSCVVVLCLLAMPFAHAQFGVADERVLPASAEAHATSIGIGRDFATPLDRDFYIVLPHTGATGHRACQKIVSYAERLASVPQVSVVRTVTGVYRGTTVRPSAPDAGMPSDERFACRDHPPSSPSAPENRPVPASNAGHPPGGWASQSQEAREALFVRRFTSGDATLITVSGPHGFQSAGARRMLARIRQVPAPGERLITGRTSQATDTLAVVQGHLPLVGTLVAGSVLVLLFLFTGGLLVSAKAVAMGALSLTAICGAVVAVFQDGHLRTVLGSFTMTHQVELLALIFTVTVAFGLSVDYEVFLLSRIKEHYRTGGDHTAAVVKGIAGTGRLVTVAAVAVAVSTGFLVASSIMLLKIIGVGLALGVLVDATVVRGLLVPAFMRLTGPANWWAPRPLARLQQRAGLTEVEVPEHRPRRPHRLARTLALLRGPERRTGDRTVHHDLTRP